MAGDFTYAKQEEAARWANRSGASKSRDGVVSRPGLLTRWKTFKAWWPEPARTVVNGLGICRPASLRDQGLALGRLHRDRLCASRAPSGALYSVWRALIESDFGIQLFPHASNARRTASGSRAITVRKARAGPLGTRRPCSPCSHVRLLFTQTESLGKLALRQADSFSDHLDINVVWDVSFAAMILQALGESESLSGALDHSFARRGV